MKILCQAAALLCMSFTCIQAAEEGAAKHGDIDALIQELSSESYRERENASLALWSEGERALLSLRKAARSDDPEMAIRASEIIEKLELYITPDTPPEVVKLVQQYRTASQNQKTNILIELKRRKAYYQMLRLYDSEERPEVAAQLAHLVRGVAILGAREAVLEGNTKMAIRILEASVNDPSNLMALAWMYKTLGQLDEKLADPNAPAGVSSDLWKITLLRAKGDMAAAAALAAESKQARLLAGLRVLIGDPRLWIEQNGFSDPNRQASDDYVKIALKRWEGKKVPEADFKKFLAALEQQDVNNEEQSYAVSSLASLGRMKEIEEYSLKNDPLMAIEFLMSQERISEAFLALGLDPEQPAYVEWVSKRFDEVFSDAKNEDEDDVQEEDPAGVALTKLKMLASFMEERGLHRELAAAFDAPLAKYAKENENHFLDLMGSLFQPGYSPVYARSVAAEWAGEDEDRWNEIYIVAFGEADEISEWLDWITEIDPELSHLGKIEVMQALFQVGIDPENLREQWMQRIWKAVEAAPEERKVDLVKRVMSLAIAAEDVVNSLKAWDILGMDQAVQWGSIDKFLTAAGRWQEAADLLDENAKFSTSSSPELHAYLAATLRQAGDEERALEHDDWAEKLSLGYAPSCRRIGDYYSYGNDPERAQLWYQRAAYQADFTENEFISALNSHAESLLEQGEWERAASCFEALMQVYAGRGFLGLPPLSLARARLKADLMKAMAVLPTDRERAVAMLERLHADFVTDGGLADHFLPIVKQAGLIEEHDRWFDESWQRFSKLIEKYPGSDNTRNTAAWLASRSGKNLKEAKAHLEIALKQRPHQYAYMDTMAETCFALGDREAAIEWSNRAMLWYPLTEGRADLMLRKQNHRFHHEGLPQ